MASAGSSQNKTLGKKNNKWGERWEAACAGVEESVSKGVFRNRWRSSEKKRFLRKNELVTSHDLFNTNHLRRRRETLADRGGRLLKLMGSRSILERIRNATKKDRSPNLSTKVRARFHNVEGSNNDPGPSRGNEVKERPSGR